MQSAASNALKALRDSFYARESPQEDPQQGMYPPQDRRVSDLGNQNVN